MPWLYSSGDGFSSATATSKLAGNWRRPSRSIRRRYIPKGRLPARDFKLASGQERAKTVNPEFAEFEDDLSFTESGSIARYFEGLTFRDLGDNAAAEKQLQTVADSRHKEIGSLAKLALGSVYQDTNRNSQALAIYKDLVERPTISVGKTTAELQLASLYESMQQPGEAAKLYQQMQKDNPSGPAAQLAMQKLQELKPH